MAFYQFYNDRKIFKVSKQLNAYFHKFIANFVMQYLKNGDDVLEIGVGQGNVAKYLAAMYSYSGYEPSLILAKTLKNSGFKIQNSFVPPLVENDKSQNVVFAIHVLEHMLNYREATDFLTEIHRVLKNDGTAIISFPDCRELGINFYHDYSHSFVTIKGRIEKLMFDCDFTIIKKQLIYGALHGLIGYLCNLTAKLILLPINVFCNFLGIEPEKLEKANYTFAKSYLFVLKKS